MENVMFLGFNLYAWITIITVLSLFIVMSKTRIPPVVAFLGALTVLLVSGIISEIYS